MTTLRPVLLLLLLALATSASAEVYRWTDAQGRVHYSDAPPPEAQAESRHLYQNRIATEKLPYETRQAAARFPITLFVGPDCGQFCDQGRAWLSKRGVPFTEQSVKTEQDAEAYRQAGGKKELMLPALSVGGQFIAGFEDGQWSRALATAGYR